MHQIPLPLFLANLHTEFAVVGVVTIIFLILFVVAGIRQIKQRQDH
jgi:hypothetical protein